jgi:hypothetical protein
MPVPAQAQASIAAAAVEVAALMSGLARSAAEEVAAALQFTLVPLAVAVAGAVLRVAAVAALRVAAEAVPRVVVAADGGSDRRRECLT